MTTDPTDWAPPSQDAPSPMPPAAGTHPDPVAAQRIQVARIVAQAWRQASLDRADATQPVVVTAHVLNCILAALDGETDPSELGISQEGPDADAIRRAAAAEPSTDAMVGDHQTGSGDGGRAVYEAELDRLRAGDPQPTGDGQPSVDRCQALFPQPVGAPAVCTLPRGHAGVHYDHDRSISWPAPEPDNAPGWVDRRAWTEQQWLDDARVIFYSVHGGAADLLNGHIMALFGELVRLRDHGVLKGQALDAALADVERLTGELANARA